MNAFCHRTSEPTKGFQRCATWTRGSLPRGAPGVRRAVGRLAGCAKRTGFGPPLVRCDACPLSFGQPDYTPAAVEHLSMSDGHIGGGLVLACVGCSIRSAVRCGRGQPPLLLAQHCVAPRPRGTDLLCDSTTFDSSLLHEVSCELPPVIAPGYRQRPARASSKRTSAIISTPRPGPCGRRARARLRR
jgi:hypothetical protein